MTIQALYDDVYCEAAKATRGDRMPTSFGLSVNTLTGRSKRPVSKLLLPCFSEIFFYLANRISRLARRLVIKTQWHGGSSSVV